MKVPTCRGLIRLGAARCLTRATVDGDFLELNSHRKWDMPPE